MTSDIDKIRLETEKISWKPPTNPRSFDDVLGDYLGDFPIDHHYLNDRLPEDVTEESLMRKMGFSFTKRQKPTLEDTKKFLLESANPQHADLQRPGVCVPAKESARAGKRRRREERAQTLGNGWFGMPRREAVDPEVEADLAVLAKRRGALEGKTNFYKKSDRRNQSKYFQVGEVIDDPRDFYSRPSKKARKRTLADDLLANEDFMNKLKAKYKKLEKKKNLEKIALRKRSKGRKMPRR